MTESIFVEDVRSVTTVLSDLAMRGIRLALDDFGTGYSSLSYLRRLPVHIVKIDRSFVADTDRRGGGDVVRAIAELAHVFGLSAIAEGVEMRDQADAVRAAGCEAAQGFFHGRPVPITEVGPLLGRVPTPRAAAITG